MVEARSERNTAICSQCGKPAVVLYGGIPLCVGHHLKMQQAEYLLFSMRAAAYNVAAGDIDQSIGGILGPTPRMELPRPPFVGETLTLNNINVSKSTVGSINTGTIQHLDSAISIMQGRGNEKVGEAIKELTEAVVNSAELGNTTKNELAELLESLASQIVAKPEDRKLGVAKAILDSIHKTASSVASLLVIWDRAQGIIHTALGL